jgi:integrase/recombinase XerC
LTLNDVDLGKPEGAREKELGFIRILGSRGKKERMIPLNDKASRALRAYLDVRGEVGTNILFLNGFGEPVSDRGIQKMLRKYLKKTGIERASVHTLRHTFGVQSLAKGTTQETLQEIMGLKDSRSTAVYVSRSRDLTRPYAQDKVHL